jgi:hypothetical protein
MVRCVSIVGLVVWVGLGKAVNLFVSGKGFDAVLAEHVVEPLDHVGVHVRNYTVSVAYGSLG